MDFLKPGPKNLISDVKGIFVGNAEDQLVNTGTTIVTSNQPFVSSYKVLGGAPGTRETDLLEPEKLVERIDAIVLSGGSAFGLEAASEVVNQLRRDDKGYPVGDQRVPIVPGAIIFDLTNGGTKTWRKNPYSDLAINAYRNISINFMNGSYGAGKGAASGPIKGGLGSASLLVEDRFMVGALMVVNSFGSPIVENQPHFWAAPYEIGDEFGGYGLPKDFNSFNPIRRASREDFTKNTVIGIVATDAKLSKSQCKAMASTAHDGIARAIFPSHTSYDGDLIFSISTGTKPLQEAPNDILRLNHAAALCVSRAIARGVYNATNSFNDLVPSFQNKFSFKG